MQELFMLTDSVATSVLIWAVLLVTVMYLGRDQARQSITTLARMVHGADVFVAVHGAVWGNSLFLRPSPPAVAVQLVPDCMWPMPHYRLCYKSPDKKVAYYAKMSELTGAAYLEWGTEHAQQDCPDADHDPYCRGGHKKDLQFNLEGQRDHAKIECF